MWQSNCRVSIFVQYSRQGDYPSSIKFSRAALSLSSSIASRTSRNRALVASPLLPAVLAFDSHSSNVNVGFVPYDSTACLLFLRFVPVIVNSKQKTFALSRLMANVSMKFSVPGLARLRRSAIRSLVSL